MFESSHTHDVCDSAAPASASDHMNSTAINDSLMSHRQSPRSELKLSPILRDEFRTPFSRRLRLCRNRGDSPLAKNNSNNHSKTTDDSAYLSKMSYSDDYKENAHSENPHSSVSINSSMRTNPFEIDLADSIHHHVLSPSLFDPNTSLKNHPSSSWTIEQRAILFPVDITDEEIAMSNSIVQDPEHEAAVHAKVDFYWKYNVCHVPSPDGPRRVVVADSPASTIEPKEAERRDSVLTSSPRTSVPVAARRRIVAMRNTASQTEMTLPVNFEFDFAKLLGNQCVYGGEDELEEEFNVSVMNSSLVKRLFANEEMEIEPHHLAAFPSDILSDLRTDESPLIRSDLGHGVGHEMHFPTAHPFHLDLTPIKSE